MLAELKRLLRLSGIYAVGDFVMKGIGLLLLPLYTAFLTPENYGTLAIASAATSILAIVLTFGLNGATLKFYYDLDGKERKALYGTLWLFLIAVPGATLLMVELFGGRPFNVFLGQVPYAPYGRLALWTAYIGIAFTTLPREIFRASGRALAYTALNASHFILATGFTIWLVVALRQGAEGALWARLIGAVGVGSVGAVVLWRASRFNLDVRLLKRALLYSLPLVPHFLSHWALSASDRIILGQHVPLADVGVYQVGYRIGGVMLMLAIAGNNAIIPMFGQLDVADGIAVKKLMRVVTYYVLGLTVIGLGITLFSSDIVYLLTPIAYHRATIVIPWVVLGYFFMGLYFIPMGVLTMVVGNTKPIPVCTTVAALTNIGLNFWLIPKYGIIAAAGTTTMSYGLMFVGIFLAAHRNKSMPYEYGRIGKILGSALVIFAATILTSSLIPTLVLRVIAKLALLSTFLMLLYSAGFLTEAERKALVEMLQRCARLAQRYRWKR